jgi:hypothetical protein
MTVAGISFLSYVVAGLTSPLGIFACGVISFVFGVVALGAALVVCRKLFARKAE